MPPVLPPAIPLLLPTPRTVRLTESSARRPDWFDQAVEDLWRQACGHVAKQWDSARIVVNDCDGTLPPTGYRVRIWAEGTEEARIAIAARRRDGVRSAVATLRQIARTCPGDLPCVEIEDAPAFTTRGVMLDVSRDKVPTMAQLRESVDLLASLKLNHLQLYTEHTFAYPGHEDVWKDWSPITPSELRELDGYCAARGIELAANQNCFGHLSGWLKKPGYQHLAEIEGNNPWYFHQWERRGPFSLCPIEPKAEAFIDELLGQLLPCLQSKLVNIGCDETFDVGWGRSKQEVERRARSASETDRSRARAELYFEFVGKIARSCEHHGRRPMMWADIALTHPEMLSMMPHGMIGLAWWYEPTDRFSRWVEALKDSGHEAWVCPGTSSWRSFTGRTTERRNNIADAAEQGKRTGATGFMVCDWGDVGHRQQWPFALAGLAQAAEAAWNPDRAREFDARAASVHVLGQAPDREEPSLAAGLLELGPWMDELGDCDLAIRKAANVANASAFFNDLHPPVPTELKPGERQVKADLPLWQEARDRLETLQGTRPPVVDARVREEIGHGVDCAIFAADHAIAMRDPNALKTSRPSLITRAEAIRAEHERLWLRRNRPGGLAHASGFYDKVISDLRVPTG
jgi:hexosaminidase